MYFSFGVDVGWFRIFSLGFVCFGGLAARKVSRFDWCFRGWGVVF